MPPTPASNALKSERVARLERWERWFAGLPMWGKVGVTAGAIFVLALSAIVIFQFLSGHSLTNIWGIGGSSNGPDVRCVVGRCGGPPTVSTPPVTPRPTIQPTPVPTARPSVTPTPLLSPTPTVQPTPTPTPPTPTPTPVPVAAASPLPTPSP